MLTLMIYVLSFKSSDCCKKYRQHADAGYALFCFTYYSVLLDLSVRINYIHITWFNVTNV